MSFGGALREPAWIFIPHYIKNFRLVQAKRNVLKKVVSRADETPTFDEGLSGHNLVAQKKVSKTQAFSMFFLTSKNIFDEKVPTMDATHGNHQICYAKRSLLIRKA